MAKPKLALIPAAQGTKLFSVLPSDGVGDFTFARGSVATRINAQGLIENVASGVSRLDYPLIDGVQKGCPHHILEPARTNVITYSEDFSNSSWSKGNSSITSDSIISPDGSLNADKLTADSSNSTHYIDTSSISFTSGVSYTVSIFVKDNNKNLVIQGSGSVTANAFASFDLKDGFIINESVGTGIIKNFGNGWYRCSLTFTSAATTSGVITFLMGETRNDSYQGDGTSGLYIYGASLEAGSYPTSYIPTTSTTVTRSAETASGAGNSTTFNDSEGVLMAEVKKINESTVTSSIVISDGTNSNRVQIALIGGTNAVYGYIQSAGAGGGTVITSNVPDFKSTNKVLVKYNTTQVTLWINGFEANTVIGNYTWSNGTLNELSFETGAGTENFYGNTKQVQYFDSTLADTQLEQLTSWTSFTDMANGQLYTIE